jgi:hypothetical protein
MPEGYDSRKNPAFGKLQCWPVGQGLMGPPLRHHNFGCLTLRGFRRVSTTGDGIRGFLSPAVRPSGFRSPAPGRARRRRSFGSDPTAAVSVEIRRWASPRQTQQKQLCHPDRSERALTPASDPPYATKDGGTPKNFHGNPQCRECGDETVRRTRRSNGSVFYGCINYPTCKATVDAQKFSTRKGAMSH